MGWEVYIQNEFGQICIFKGWCSARGSFIYEFADRLLETQIEPEQWGYDFLGFL